MYLVFRITEIRIDLAQVKIGKCTNGKWLLVSHCDFIVDFIVCQWKVQGWIRYVMISNDDDDERFKINICTPSWCTLLPPPPVSALF